MPLPYLLRSKAFKYLNYLVFFIITFLGIFVFHIGTLYSSPHNHPVGSPPPAWAAQSITLQANSASPRLAAWFSPPHRPMQDSCVLLLHGIKSHRKDIIPIAQFFKDAGYGIFLFDFRGHGESEAYPVTLGLREAEDAHTAFDWLKIHGQCRKIAVWGQSMGGAAALLGKEPLEMDALILDSTYATIDLAIRHRLITMVGKTWASYLAPLLEQQLPWRLNIRKEQLRPVSVINRVHVPTLIIYGSKDQSAYPEEAYALYQASGAENKSIWMSLNAGHGKTHSMHHKEYEKITLDFLANSL